MAVVDINCTFGPGLDTLPELFGPLWARPGVADLLADLDAAGADRAVINPPAWGGGEFIDPCYEAGNRAVHEAIGQCPERLIGVGRANPSFGGRGLAAARRCLEEFGFHGLLLDPGADGFSPLDLQTLAPYADLCSERGLPLLVVSGIHPVQPMLYVPLALAHPGVPIVLLRMGAFVADDAIMAAGLASNLCLETSGQRASDVKRAVDALGPERVVFGSGYPYASTRVERGKLEALTGLSPQSRSAILGGNALRLLNTP